MVSSVFAKVIEGAEILQRILSNIHAKICTKQKGTGTADTDDADGYCHGNNSKGAGGKLSDAVANGADAKWPEHNTGPNTATTVSKDVSGLSREEKGVVSSVFAKVVEGAEIL